MTKLNDSAPIIAGLVIGVILIVLFSTVGMSSLSHYSRYDLGTKDALVSALSEYFAREPENAVRLTDGAYYEASVAGGQDIYAYGLIVDDERHGVLRVTTYPAEMRAYMVSVEWDHDGDTKLRNAGDLLVSGIADSTIPDWSNNDDGQPNRNAKILRWIDTNNKCSEDFVKDYLSQHRTLFLSACDDHFVLVVKIES